MLPFHVKKIDHVVLRVRSLEDSIAFYGRTLGCEVVLRRDELGLVHLRAGVSMLDLVSLDGALGARGGAGPGKEGRNVDHLCLRIEPFDEEVLIGHLAACDVTPLDEAGINFGAEGYGPSLYFADPDGNIIELKGPSSK